MDYNISVDNKDFIKAFEIFFVNQKTEVMDFLKGDTFYLKPKLLLKIFITSLIRYHVYFLKIFQ